MPSITSNDSYFRWLNDKLLKTKAFLIIGCFKFNNLKLKIVINAYIIKMRYKFRSLRNFYCINVDIDPCIVKCITFDPCTLYCMEPGRCK